MTTFRMTISLIFIFISFNAILSYFIALFATVPHFRKIIAAKGFEDVKPIFMHVFFARPLAFAAYITMEFCSSKPWPNEMYGDLSLFKEHARWWDVYLAFSMIGGFVVLFIMMIFIKTFDYFMA